MPPFALALIAIAAVLHATWNVILKTSGDPLLTAVRLQAIGTLVLGPLAVIAWFVTGEPAIDPEGVAIALVSGGLEALYFFLLAEAYARGDLSMVYPLARGSAPLLAVLIGIGVLGEQLVPIAWVGVIAVIVGILAVAQPWRALGAAGREHRGAVAFALATGATIAAYSAVDREGVRILVPWLYGAVLAVFSTIILGTIVLVGRRRGILGTPAPLVGPDGRPVAGVGARAAVAGVLSLTAYLLILFAYSVAPLAAVAPLRESAVVLGAAWGSIRLGEAARRREAGVRIGAAALVVVGAVLVAIGEV
ncbi:MAG TPA: EamA family transporter [Candidatus Limnocylindrales bacterium]|nr:EamA family transporter [Candidatus Limnocylindrales bacterium]